MAERTTVQTGKRYFPVVCANPPRTSFRTGIQIAQMFAKSPEVIEKRRHSSKQMWQDPEYRSKQAIHGVKRGKAAWATEELRQRQIAARRGKKPSKEARENMRQAALNMDPKLKEMRIIASQKALRKRGMNSLELAMSLILKSLKLKYEYQRVFGRWAVDFYLPTLNLVVECDGAYWHSRPDVKKADVRRNKGLRQMGLRVLRLSDKDIRSGKARAKLDQILKEEK